MTEDIKELKARTEAAEAKVRKLCGLIAEAMDTELGQMACVGSDAPCEDILGRLNDAAGRNLAAQEAAKPSKGGDVLNLIVRDVAELDYSSDTVLDMMQVSEADLRRIIERHCAALVQPADPRPLFGRKLADLQQRGYEVIGRILHKNGEYALFDSSCRWLTTPQYQRLMHEQDGSLFAQPAERSDSDNGAVPLYVGNLILGGIEGEEYDDCDTDLLMPTIEALQEKCVTTEDAVLFDLYAVQHELVPGNAKLPRIDRAKGSTK